MSFNSSEYNLSNPAFTEDIGRSFGFNPMPMPQYNYLGGLGYIPGITGTMDNVILRGPLKSDIADIPRREKDKKIWTSVFKAIALVGAGLLTYKFGKKIFSFCADKLKHLFKKN